jgi:hypothetical protein
MSRYVGRRSDRTEGQREASSLILHSARCARDCCLREDANAFR